MKIDGKTVLEHKAEKFVELVKRGASPAEAAKEIGATLAELRRAGTLAKACREAIQRAEEEKLLDAEVRKKLRKARLLELMMQDEDKRVAIAAIKADQVEHSVGNPAVAVQLNVIRDQKVVEMLKSLQIEVEGESPSG
ncbi:MAG TPA: hypothetical protein PLN86_16025 [Candidatus Hydrogenedentes bacterium]|nr:hypothetical protein [Candidatus Hydrogenedentota bacterium]